ncbi:unnamed protein product [Dovyalis caffra]|uniref:Uncharacterized protein n=1 Tax=Dovyalis caffra TaxID=77055 RepID=A0AAV1RPL3_9ROSI|nr:unnamed protein product [Dovyalis caffra]
MVTVNEVNTKFEAFQLEAKASKKSMDESLETRSEFPWNEDVMISMYRQGLNLQISSGLATCRLYTMADAVQVAAQIEEEAKTKTSMRSTTTSNGKNESPAIDLSKEGMSVHSQPVNNPHGSIPSSNIAPTKGKEVAEQESDLAGNSLDFGVYEADDLDDDENAVT